MKTLCLCLLAATAAWGQPAPTLCVRHLVVPGYAGLARAARLQGAVRVEIEINAEGKVISAKASGAHALLQHAAEENVRQWTFAANSGHSGLIHLTITYVYALKGKEMYYTPSPTVVLDLPDRVTITTHPAEIQP